METVTYECDCCDRVIPTGEKTMHIEYRAARVELKKNVWGFSEKPKMAHICLQCCLKGPEAKIPLSAFWSY